MIWDIAIIGGGAAGLMTAICAARHEFEIQKALKRKPNILLLDGREKIGAKILMSGGTRCNLTNAHVKPTDFQSESPRFVRDVLSAFSSERTVSVFREMGLEVIQEEGGKYFPATHSGKTVLDALVREVKNQNIVLQTGKKVQRIDLNSTSQLFKITGVQFQEESRTVVICTGGLSFPSTGSDGAGYKIALSFDHSLVETSPSLTPLKTSDARLRELSGLTLPKVNLRLMKNGRCLVSYEGSFLFTHFGFSGPAALNLSRHWIREEKTGSLSVEADFLPDESPDETRLRFISESSSHSTRSIKRVLVEWLPERLIDTLLRRIDVLSNVKLNQFSKIDREKLVKALHRFELPVTGSLGYEKAEVTAGGVNLNEVDSKTMESRKRKGLFFAGEILDADGRIGGFNFQWAWSTAYVAANGVTKRLTSASNHPTDFE